MMKLGDGSSSDLSQTQTWPNNRHDELQHGRPVSDYLLLKIIENTAILTIRPAGVSLHGERYALQDILGDVREQLKALNPTCSGVVLNFENVEGLVTTDDVVPAVLILTQDWSNHPALTICGLSQVVEESLYRMKIIPNKIADSNVHLSLEQALIALRIESGTVSIEPSQSIRTALETAKQERDKKFIESLQDSSLAPETRAQMHVATLDADIGTVLMRVAAVRLQDGSDILRKFEAELSSLAASAKHIEIDLSGVHHLGSEAIASLFVAHRTLSAKQGSLSITNLEQPVYEALRIKRLHQLVELQLAPNREAV